MRVVVNTKKKEKNTPWTPELKGPSNWRRNHIEKSGFNEPKEEGKAHTL